MKHILLLLSFLLLLALGTAVQATLYAANAPTVKEEEMYNNKTPMFGVRLRPVNLSTLEAVGLAPGQGTMITHVFPGSAADQMGLQEGDVIIDLNGTEINSRRDVRTNVLSNNSGDSFEVTVLRDNSDPITRSGNFTTLPAWIEAPLRAHVSRMGERWENKVKEKQLEILANREAALDKAEAAIADMESQLYDQAQSNTHTGELLPAIVFPSATCSPAASLPSTSAQQNSIPAWHFIYAHNFDSNVDSNKGRESCDSLSLVGL